MMVSITAPGIGAAGTIEAASGSMVAGAGDEHRRLCGGADARVVELGHGPSGERLPRHHDFGSRAGDDVQLKLRS
jgi:hypothetical protein